MKLDRHLLASDFERYLDQSDLSEIYLYWLEPVAEHLEHCTACQEKLQRIIQIDWMIEEGVSSMADTAAREADIRRMALVSRLRQMYLEQEKAIEGYRVQHLMYHILQNSIYRTTKTQRDQLRPSAFVPPSGSSIQHKAFSMSGEYLRRGQTPSQPSMPMASYSMSMPSSSASHGSGAGNSNISWSGSSTQEEFGFFQNHRLSYSDGVLHVEISLNQVKPTAVTIMLEGTDRKTGDRTLMVKPATQKMKMGRDIGIWEADFEIPELQDEYDVYFDVIKE